MRILLLIAFLCFSQSAQSVIVFLRGTSCAGKTSICKEIQKIDNSWKVVDEDAIFFEQFPIFWEQRFPHEFISILKVIDRPNLVHAIMRNQIFFIKTATEKEKKEAIQSIEKIRQICDERSDETVQFKSLCTKRLQEYIYNQINDHIKNGFNVLIDSTGTLKKDKIDELAKKNKIVLILLYSPLGIMVNRILERNDSAVLDGNFITIRFFHQALTNFLNLYDLVSELDINNFNKENVIEITSKQKIEEVLDFVCVSMIETHHAIGFNNFFTWGEFNKEEFNKYKELIINKFNNGFLCYVIPQIKFDILIRSDKNTPHECAKIISLVQ